MDAHQHGLEHDLHTLLKSTADRRQVLRWLGLGAAASLPLIGCGGGGDSSTATTSASSTTSSGSSTTSATSATNTGTTSSTSSASCTVIPEETQGPYPADGSNSNTSNGLIGSGGVVNALQLSGIVRSDIRASVSPGTAVAAGVPLTLKLQLINTNSSCAPLAGYAIYIWHCDRDGNYSMYSTGLTNENYLRGVQETDSSGSVTFTTIFPGCYLGRMTHIHFEIYPSLAKATSAANKIKTSQLTFPLATINEAYTATGYATSVANLKQISYATDMVFSDGYSLQMATVTGSVSTGYVATLPIAIAV